MKNQEIMQGEFRAKPPRTQRNFKDGPFHHRATETTEMNPLTLLCALCVSVVNASRRSRDKNRLGEIMAAKFLAFSASWREKSCR